MRRHAHDPSQPSPRACVRACVRASHVARCGATSRMRKRRGTEALAASLITAVARVRAWRACSAPAIRSHALTCHVCRYVCMYVYLCSTCCRYIQTAYPAQSEGPSYHAAAASATVKVTHQPHSPALPYLDLSVMPHAFDEFVRSNKSVSTVCAPCCMYRTAPWV
jgi:hypothetical protein